MATTCKITYPGTFITHRATVCWGCGADIKAGASCFIPTDEGDDEYCTEKCYVERGKV